VKAAAAALALAAGLGLAACGGGSSSTARPAVTPTPNPVAACHQLAAFHNTGQGLSRAFRAQLLTETRGTLIYGDMRKWLNDLSITPAQIAAMTASQDEATIIQLAQDASAVGTDCDDYYNVGGVMNGT